LLEKLKLRRHIPNFVKKSGVVYTEFMVLPLQFLKFWFVDSPRNLIAFFASLSDAFLQLSSLGLLVKTYFKPWKNEYRDGLVGFSIGMGMFIKTFVILADLILFCALIFLEAFFTLGFILCPILSLFLLNNIPLFLLSILCILVVFFVFKPKKEWIDSIPNKSTLEIVKELLLRKDVLFVLQKMEITKSEIQLIDLSKTTLFNNMGDKTPLDIFKTYLVLTEEKTKLLFNKKLKIKDLEDIVTFAKFVFPDISRRPFKIEFWGEGIGESWASGWTLETSKYMVDITSYAVNKKPMIFGREEEYKEVVESLSNNKSCLLVGEPGSGRGAFVNALAYNSFIGKLKGNLHHQRFFELLADALLAGSQNQGQLEERLENVIREISHAGNVIIYVPNFENIMGASTFNTDLSGALIPYLQKGIIRIIANITPGSFKKFIEPKHTLNSIFEFVKFEEPSRDATFQMLLRKSLEIEEKNKVIISYKAVVATLNFANKYLQDRVMPGAGVTLLEDVANAVSMKGKKIVEEQDVINKVEEKTKIAVGSPKEEEKELLLHLEEELHKRIIGQNEAIFEVSESLRRLRAGLNNSKKPISFLFLGPTGVGKTATAKAISDIYYGGENKMIRLDMSEYSTDDSVKRFLGGNMDSKGLTDMVCENPYSLVLLDEFEKSNSKIIDLFLQVLDDGRLTDNKGKTVSFADNIIIATSNAASEYIREEVNKGTTIDKNFQKNLLEFLQEKGTFRPEFLNRFDGIVVFKPLEKEEILQIIKLMLQDLSKKLLEKDVTVNFDEKITAKIAAEGFDQEFGARPLKRFIQDSIEDLIAQKMLKDEINRGDKINLSVDSSSKILIVVNA
jgi:ATP-dependent Clp protease ATP-binding subunit ClpC